MGYSISLRKSLKKESGTHRINQTSKELLNVVNLFYYSPPGAKSFIEYFFQVHREESDEDIQVIPESSSDETDTEQVFTIAL